jgi:hypothetical protein
MKTQKNLFFDEIYDAHFDWKYTPNEEYLVYKRTFGMNGRKKQSRQEV